MKIAVTSAGGALGSAIVNELKSSIGTKNIIGIARTPANAANLGVEIRKGDYNSFDEYREALKGIEAVLLVSGNDHPDKRIQQHRNVIHAAKEAGVKKIVYTSIFGAESGNNFSPVVKSNRQTEEDVKSSGLKWAIGRNGIYIEPDLEYIDTYKKDGAIINCAGDGKCGYTSRYELAVAYTAMLTNDSLNGKIFNLFGACVTQAELAEVINRKYKLNLKFKHVTPEDYRKERIEHLGVFMGEIIAGIYEGIRQGNFEGHSNFDQVAGRAHKSLDELIEDFKED